MTESELAELNRKIAVMEASKTKAIECSEAGCNAWAECRSPVRWNWQTLDYRVKQSPRRAMLTVSEDGRFWTAYDPITESAVIEKYYGSGSMRKLVEFIELTPEIRQKLGITD